MTDKDAGASSPTGYPLVHKIVAVIGATTLILGAVATLVDTSVKVKKSISDLMPVGPTNSNQQGMVPPSDRRPDIQHANVGASLPAEPKPHPNCSAVYFSDNSKIPPATSVSWKC
jgi:hypothetical protein